jgi:hypothetical protein
MLSEAKCAMNPRGNGTTLELCERKLFKATRMWYHLLSFTLPQKNFPFVLAMTFLQAVSTVTVLVLTVRTGLFQGYKATNIYVNGILVFTAV